METLNAAENKSSGLEDIKLKYGQEEGAQSSNEEILCIPDLVIHEPKPKKHPCDECAFSGTSPWNLKQHKESIHEGIR